MHNTNYVTSHINTTSTTDEKGTIFTKKQILKALGLKKQ